MTKNTIILLLITLPTSLLLTQVLLKEKATCTEGNCSNTFGTLETISKVNKFKFGYSGNWRKGKRNGVGSEIFKDGSTYKGSWKNNQFNGLALFNSNQYSIIVLKNIKLVSKKNTFIFKQIRKNIKQIRYKGLFKKHLLHGKGTLTVEIKMNYLTDFLIKWTSKIVLVKNGIGKPYLKQPRYLQLIGHFSEGNFQKGNIRILDINSEVISKIPYNILK